MLPVRDYLALLSSTLTGLGRRVVALALALLLAIGLQLYNPQLLRRIIDGALAGDPRDALLPLAGAFVALAVVAQLVVIVASWLAEEVGWRATNRLRADLTAHVLDLDLSFHTTHSPGHLIERVDGDVTACANFFSAMTVKVLGNGLLLLGIVALVWRESWLLGLAVGGLTGGALLGFARLHGVTVPWWKAVSVTQADLYGHVGEQVAGAEDVVPNGAAGFMQERFADRLRTYLPQFVRGWTGYGLMWGSSRLLASATTLAVYALGAVLLDAGTLSVGGVFLVTYYVGMLERPLHDLRSEFQDLQKAGGAIARIEDLRAVTSAMPPAGDATLPGGPLAVRFDGVGFTYPDEDDGSRVLHDVDLTVGAGRVLGVVGRTGSGKSSLGKLAVRLYDADVGQVRLGGVPVAAAADLRRRVAVVTQEVQLFRATVRENLTFFADGVEDARLLAVLDDLALTGWLSTLPDGLDTVLDGADLSAGQAQLLAFARVFLRDPGLVVMDEASSRLDAATEALLERAVDRLLAGRTGIVVAHRLATLDRVDDVAVMDAGRVVEHGPRDVLAADPGSRFARLLAAGLQEVDA